MNRSGNPASLTAPKFEPGKSGNPGGKPASRMRLTTRFINALADDFDKHGDEAIQRCRIECVAVYLKAIVALCPKEVEIKRPLQEMEDAELLTGVRALESFLAARADEARASPAPSRDAVN